MVRCQSIPFREWFGGVAGLRDRNESESLTHPLAYSGVFDSRLDRLHGGHDLSPFQHVSPVPLPRSIVGVRRRRDGHSCRHLAIVFSGCGKETLANGYTYIGQFEKGTRHVRQRPDHLLERKRYRGALEKREDHSEKRCDRVMPLRVGLGLVICPQAGLAIESASGTAESPRTTNASKGTCIDRRPGAPGA